MTRVHKEPLVPLFLFDFLPVPGRGEERSDNASTSPTTEDENESGRHAVPARHCEGYRREGFVVGPTKPETRGHGHAESFPYFDRRRIPDTGTRVGKSDQKARQTPMGPADGDFAEVRPIDLSLLSGKTAQSQEGLLVNWPQTSHHTSQLHHASGVTALPDHLVDARGTQPGILL